MASIKGHHKRVQIDVWLDKKRTSLSPSAFSHGTSLRNAAWFAPEPWTLCSAYWKSLPFLLPRLVEWVIRMVLLLDFFWLLHVLVGQSSYKMLLCPSVCNIGFIHLVLIDFTWSYKMLSRLARHGIKVFFIGRNSRKFPKFPFYP